MATIDGAAKGRQAATVDLDNEHSGFGGPANRASSGDGVSEQHNACGPEQDPPARNLGRPPHAQAPVGEGFDPATLPGMQLEGIGGRACCRSSFRAFRRG